MNYIKQPEGSYAYISSNGKVDRYSMGYSRNPVALYSLKNSDDISKIDEIFNAIDNKTSKYLFGTDTSEDMKKIIASTPPTTMTTASGKIVSADIFFQKTVIINVDSKIIISSSVASAEAIINKNVTEIAVSDVAVAVVTKDNKVIAGANKDGSLDSESTISALKTAIKSTEKVSTIIVKAGNEITEISKSTMQKIAKVGTDNGVVVKIQSDSKDGGSILSRISIDALENSDNIKTGIVWGSDEINGVIEKLSSEYNLDNVRACLESFQIIQNVV